MNQVIMQDLAVREVTNGMWFLLPVCIAIVFARHAVTHVRRQGWTSDVEIATMFSVFLVAGAAARAAVWLLFMGVPIPNYAVLALGTMLAGEAAGARLIFLLTPDEAGHSPWIVSVAISVGLPFGVILLRFLMV